MVASEVGRGVVDVGDEDEQENSKRERANECHIVRIDLKRGPILLLSRSFFIFCST